ncbi:MAG: LysR substrate-binding domain-containing protein, partial [Tateyamaria sp.]
WLDDALVLLEERNLTRAAARRNITQPAFSRRIRSFEDWLGTPVLDRGSNSIGLSPALAANEREIRALSERIYALRGRIANFEPARSTITIAAQHAPIHSTFPDMAVWAKHLYPTVSFRMQAGDHRDCVSMFLRRDTDILLCYEAEGDPPLPFGDAIKRAVWGTDYLVPVLGGDLRNMVAADGSIPDDLPAIVYPTTSYFGEILGKRAKPFGTSPQSRNVACETAFSNGIKELALKGIGVGWVPLSMSQSELESGDLVSVAPQLGELPVQNTLYAYAADEVPTALLNAWDKKGGVEAPVQPTPPSTG